jgi:hypothetical protein
VLPYKKMLVLSGLTAFTMLGIIAAKVPREERLVYKNLQVLSKNITDENMDYVMGSFNSGLGANCLFCHPGRQNGTEFSINYVTDSLRNKRVAREMLRMTMRLNKKYFNTKLTGLMETRGKIWCKTCHRSNPVPILFPPKKTNS